MPLSNWRKPSGTRNETATLAAIGMNRRCNPEKATRDLSIRSKNLIGDVLSIFAAGRARTLSLPRSQVFRVQSCSHRRRYTKSGKAIDRGLQVGLQHQGNHHEMPALRNGQRTCQQNSRIAFALVRVRHDHLSALFARVCRSRHQFGIEPPILRISGATSATISQRRIARVVRPTDEGTKPIISIVHTASDIIVRSGTPSRTIRRDGVPDRMKREHGARSVRPYRGDA